MLFEELYQIQHRHGFLPKDELFDLSHRTDIPLYRLEEVTSFYPHFRRTAPPKVEVRVCRDMACHMNGACQISDALGQLDGQYTKEQLSIGETSCLGRCDRAPAMYINTTGNSGEDEDFRVFANLNPERARMLVDQMVEAVLEPGGPATKPAGDADSQWRPGEPDHWQIDIYRGKPTSERYAAVRHFAKSSAGLSLELGETPDDDVNTAIEVDEEQKKKRIKKQEELAGPRNLGLPFMQEHDPARQRLIISLHTADLLGMGGAGGRAYKKWFEVRQAEGDDKYVVCNGDESEPGTFKDRELLLHAPHLVIEGVILAGLYLHAKAGFIYIRHEYPEQIAAVRKEIKQAESLGLCGEDVLGLGISFPIEVVVSPGGYICGEQTALIEALEGRPAEPRNRPPALQANGLWNQPTLLNNVETLAWVPAIISERHRDSDGQWFAGLAQHKRYRGKRFFSISGDVHRPGVYEVRNGIRLRQLIEVAGGTTDGVKGVALSGPSGGFLPGRLPWSFVEHRKREVDRQFVLSIPRLRQSVIELESAAADVIADQPESKEKISRLKSELQAFEKDVEELPKSIQNSLEELDALTEVWTEQAALASSATESRRAPSRLDLQRELTIKLARRTVKLGNTCTNLERTRVKLEQLLKSMFPDGAESTSDVLDLELDIGNSRAVGFMLGAGIVIYGQGRDMVAEALNCTEFYRNESCGQCVPCRIGSQKLVEIATRLHDDEFDGAEWTSHATNLVQPLSSAMEATSICGLGVVASNPLTTLVKYFQQDIQRHLKQSPDRTA